MPDLSQMANTKEFKPVMFQAEPGLYRQLKAASKEDRRTIKAICHIAVKEWLDRRKAQLAKAEP